MGIRITIECDSEDGILAAVAECTARLRREARAGIGHSFGKSFGLLEDGTLEELGRYRIDHTPE